MICPCSLFTYWLRSAGISGPESIRDRCQPGVPSPTLSASIELSSDSSARQGLLVVSDRSPTSLRSPRVPSPFGFERLARLMIQQVDGRSSHDDRHGLIRDCVVYWGTPYGGPSLGDLDHFKILIYKNYIIPISKIRGYKHHEKQVHVRILNSMQLHFCTNNKLKSLYLFSFYDPICMNYNVWKCIMFKMADTKHSHIHFENSGFMTIHNFK